MNLEKLELKTYKNYKELCVVLDEGLKAGKSRSLQIKRWEKYFKYIKQGQKFIIEEIYTEPLTKENAGNNNKYIFDIQDILTDYIYKNRNPESGKVMLSFSKLINILGLVNDTYTIANCRKKELSDILNIELRAVYFFYNNTRSEFKRIIERALKNLENRSVIHCNKIYMIAEKVKTDDGDYYVIHREATDSETTMITDIQKMTLEHLNLSDFQKLFLSGSTKYKEFTQLALQECPSNWLYYFKAYELLVGEYAIKQEFNIIKKRRLDLNKKAIERVTNTLKVLDENDNERILIDKLVDILNHDFKLDEDIKELYEKKKNEKDEKIIKNIRELAELREKELEIVENTAITQKLYDERDAIDKYDYFTYANGKKQKEEVAAWGFNYYQYSSIYEVMEELL